MGDSGKAFLYIRELNRAGLYEIAVQSFDKYMDNTDEPFVHSVLINRPREAYESQ